MVRTGTGTRCTSTNVVRTRIEYAVSMTSAVAATAMPSEMGSMVNPQNAMAIRVEVITPTLTFSFDHRKPLKRRTKLQSMMQWKA
jgi:hypothetical protein